MKYSKQKTNEKKLLVIFLPQENLTEEEELLFTETGADVVKKAAFH